MTDVADLPPDVYTAAELTKPRRWLPVLSGACFVAFLGVLTMPRYFALDITVGICMVFLVAAVVSGLLTVYVDCCLRTEDEFIEEVADTRWTAELAAERAAVFNTKVEVAVDAKLKARRSARNKTVSAAK